MLAITLQDPSSLPYRPQFVYHVRSDLTRTFRKSRFHVDQSSKLGPHAIGETAILAHKQLMVSCLKLHLQTRQGPLPFRPPSHQMITPATGEGVAVFHLHRFKSDKGLPKTFLPTRYAFQ
jgi:hypothetical protein